MYFKIIRAFSFSLLIAAKSLIQSLMKSSGRITSISMAIKGEADIRQEDSMRKPPNQLHTSSNTDNNLSAHLSFFVLSEMQSCLLEFPCWPLWWKPLIKQKLSGFCCNYSTLTFGRQSSGFLPCLEPNRNGLQKGQGYSSLNYSKCLLISSCWCWLIGKGCLQGARWVLILPPEHTCWKTAIHFMSLFLLGQPTSQ